MVSLLDDSTVLDHDHPVGISDCRQAVGNDEARSPLHQLVKRLLDLHLGPCVDRTRRLVEDQDSRIREDRPCNGDELPLTLGQVCATLRELRVVSLREFADEPIGVGQLRGLDDLVVGRVEAAVADVLHDRLREQERLLEDDTELPSQRRLGRVPDVGSVDPRRSALDLVEARQKVNDRRFPRSGRSHQRDRLSGLRVKADVPEHLDVGDVGERHVVELDCALNLGEIHGIDSIAQVRRLVEHFEDSLGPCKRLLDLVVQPTELAKWLRKPA